MTSSAPHLSYAAIAGRAELIRLIAAAGGVTITEAAEEFAKPTLASGMYQYCNYLMYICVHMTC